MITNGSDQNGGKARAVSAQGIRKYLIAHNGALLGLPVIFGQALADSFGEWLFRMGDAVQPIFLAKHLYSIPLGITHHAHLHMGCAHFLEPAFHPVRGDAGGVGHYGVVKVQH